MTTIRFVILVAGLMLFTGYASGQGGAVKPAPGAEVTIKGILLWEKACAPDESAVGDGQVLYAVDGTPEVKAEMDRLMKECYTSDTLNAEQAVKVLERFNERLKYYLVPSSIIDKKGCQYANPAVAVTGVLSEKDGKKWITPSKIVPEFKLKYPDRMLMPDKPFLVPGKDPLLLKVNDKLSLKCILIPPGKFLMRLPFYVWPRYQDEYAGASTGGQKVYIYNSIICSNTSGRQGGGVGLNGAALPAPQSVWLYDTAIFGNQTPTNLWGSPPPPAGEPYRGFSSRHATPPWCRTARSAATREWVSP